ncbi:YigZ family protein [Campylobacter fetus]|uniref:YigZ family protein n=1 Tax=Campylobacter fetus TaxID=196 RepID=UPI000818A486|nr:YigZ family protein [Campylobacter fetus]OCR93075.1 phosphoenolpyruvate carboxykinase [Campylobacter fetus subsp. testudinum]OCR97955.1 phosphoenolpyruvate carboxykinase [Campylobacter fetus subsp. testudinum]
MFIVNQIYNSSKEIKKSNFISYLCPINEFETLHKKLKEEHPKAAHIVWAYRNYNKHFQIVENSSDDGEPKSSSGPPCLDVLRGANLINTGVFVVRYFGGVKLGVGGLVRAYSSSANLAINSANLIKFEIQDECLFFIPFALLARFNHYFEKHGLKDEKKEFVEQGSIYTFKFKKEDFEEFFKFAKDFEVEGFYFLAVPIFAKEII